MFILIGKNNPYKTKHHSLTLLYNNSQIWDFRVIKDILLYNSDLCFFFVYSCLHTSYTLITNHISLKSYIYKIILFLAANYSLLGGAIDWLTMLIVWSNINYYIFICIGDKFHVLLAKAILHWPTWHFSNEEWGLTYLHYTIRKNYLCLIN